MYRVIFTTNIDRELLKRLNHLSVEEKIWPNQILEQVIMV
jgi:hypothetical protein